MEQSGYSEQVGVQFVSRMINLTSVSEKDVLYFQRQVHFLLPAILKSSETQTFSAITLDQKHSWWQSLT